MAPERQQISQEARLVPDDSEAERKRRLAELRDYLERRSWQTYINFKLLPAAETGRTGPDRNRGLRQQAAAD